MKNVAIIQARMGSSRLPNKMLLNFHGQPIIKWVFHRVLKAKKIDQEVFAIPDKKRDDELFLYLKSINALVYRGNENDFVFSSLEFPFWKNMMNVCFVKK